jgi:hypothetical protein
MKTMSIRSALIAVTAAHRRSRAVGSITIPETCSRPITRGTARVTRIARRTSGPSHRFNKMTGGGADRITKQRPPIGRPIEPSPVEPSTGEVSL